MVRKTESGNDYFKEERGEWTTQWGVGRNRPALSSLPDDETKFPASHWLRRLLRDGVEELRLDSLAMRQPVSPREPTHFKADGSNLPLVLDDLKRRRPERYDEWVKHLKTIVPDLATVEVERRKADNFRYVELRYDSGPMPAWLVSDGTLRMLALTLLAYTEAEDRMYLIEEPENGLHPRALEPVYQSLSSIYEGQVLLATHSILLLNLAKPEEILVFARTRSGAADIVSGTDHPALEEWQGDVDLGTLLAAGVLE